MYGENLQHSVVDSSSPSGQSIRLLHQFRCGIQVVLFRQRNVPTGHASVNRFKIL